MEARNVKLSDMQVTAKLLRELRESTGMSQRELADKLECQQPAIARLESGTIRPNLVTLDRIAEALGFEFQHLVVSREQAFSTGIPVIPVRSQMKKS